MNNPIEQADAGMHCSLDQRQLCMGSHAQQGADGPVLLPCTKACSEVSEPADACLILTGSRVCKTQQRNQLCIRS